MALWSFQEECLYISVAAHASVASKANLLRLRAQTVADRGEDGDVNDFRWLLDEVARDGRLLPALDVVEKQNMMDSAHRLGVLDRLVLVAVLGGHNDKAGKHLLGL